jgi:hypothetical protein
MSRPAHAFPTTYPPPIRPPPGVSPVGWPRAPEPLPTRTSTIDIDSLCTQFTASLQIDKYPRQSPQSKPSTFSLPVVAREELGNTRSRPKPPKRSRFSRSEEPPMLSAARSCTPLPNAAKYRRHSIPPFPSSSSRAKATPRKTSTPPRVSTLRQTPEPSQSSDLTHHTGPEMSTYLLDSPTTNSDAYSYPVLNALHDQRPPAPFDSTWDRSAPTPQDLPYSFNGPTTPPTLLPDLLSEPIVVPGTPIHLSPRSSLMPIVDPFLQFEPQYDYFSGSSTNYALNYSTLPLGLATDGLSSKTMFDPLPRFNHLFQGNPIPATPDNFENTLFNTYTML